MTVVDGTKAPMILRRVTDVRFTLEWKDDDTVWLRLEGGPGVKEAIAAEMGFESQR